MAHFDCNLGCHTAKYLYYRIKEPVDAALYPCVGEFQAVIHVHLVELSHDTCMITMNDLTVPLLLKHIAFFLVNINYTIDIQAHSIFLVSINYTIVVYV